MVSLLKVHNTLTRKTGEFAPIKKGEVKMYVCGPTVYGPGHIGHARTYIAFDIIRRYLEYRGLKVNYVVNITDIHDDMVKQANKEGVTIFELADRNIKIFMKDLQTLGIKIPTKMPRVTEHIKEIIDMVKTLQGKGFAYETDDGVYFAISMFKDYGKLSGAKVKKSITGTRVEKDKYEKENPMDFALWKKTKEGEPSWGSPWGRGRPGWHIECSAMSAKYLGEQFDIHGGAVDLVFPHHENEIAQSEAAFGAKPFVKYWLHAGFLNVGGKKMSKSLGNYITIPQLLGRFDPRAFRFFISGLHYRSAVDFNDEAIARAAKGLTKWNNTIQLLLRVTSNQDNPEIGGLVKKARLEFEKTMDEDFNLPMAWAGLYGFQSKINALLSSGQISKTNAAAVIGFFKELNTIFDFFEFAGHPIAIGKELMDSIKLRDNLRVGRKFAEADKIRKELLEKGIELFDTPDGVKWKKIGK